MARTKIVIESFLPTTSTSRVSDAVAAVLAALGEHRAEDIFTTYSGPHPDNVKNGEAKNDRRVEQRGPGRDEDRDEGGREAGEGRSGGNGRNAGADAGKRSGGDGGDGDGAEPVKRGRGRPRKSEAPGPTGEDGDGGRKRGADRAEGGEDARRNEPVRTREVADEGAGEGQGRRRSADRSGDDQRGDREAPRVRTHPEDRGEQDDGWGDEKAPADDKNSEGWDDNEEAPELIAARSRGEWPDELLPCDPDKVDKTVIQTLLGEHLKATGGKDREITFDVMEKATGQRSLPKVDPDDYLTLAKSLMKDAAQYDYGLKK